MCIRDRSGRFHGRYPKTFTLFVRPSILLPKASSLHIGPVSYTHLDVYKRQYLESAADFAKNIITCFARFNMGLFTALYMVLVRVTPFFSLCDVREQQSLNKEGGA